MKNIKKLSFQSSEDVEIGWRKLSVIVNKLEAPWYLIEGAKDNIKKILWEIEGAAEWLEEHLEES